MMILKTDTELSFEKSETKRKIVPADKETSIKQRARKKLKRKKRKAKTEVESEKKEKQDGKFQDDFHISHSSSAGEGDRVKMLEGKEKLTKTQKKNNCKSCKNDKNSTEKRKISRAIVKPVYNLIQDVTSEPSYSPDDTRSAKKGTPYKVIPLDSSQLDQQSEFEPKLECTNKIADSNEMFSTFEETPFGDATLKCLKDAGFKAPTEIQARVWPHVLQRKDIVAISKTGSGKTLGFLLPICYMIKNGIKQMGRSKNSVYFLVLAPTRELALQIETECKVFASELSSVCIYGGVARYPQISVLKSKHPKIIIATPGRMNDMVECKAVSLNQTEYVVLDEADRMLDMGFEPQISKIFKTVSPKRQTLLFSATWPPKVHSMAEKYLKRDARAHILVGESGDLVANKSITQIFKELDDSEKDMALWKIVQELPKNAKLLTFANTKRRIDYLANACWAEGYGSSAIHGGKTQQERMEALENFATGRWPLMFATDVCARGLDIQGVTHVINFDMPRDVDSYIHRIGRTGRAGRSGYSITFWNKDYDQHCAGALAKIAREAGQDVPKWLDRWAKKATKSKCWNY